MNQNKTNEILALCDKLNLTLIDYSSNSITNEHRKKQTYVRFICNIHQKYGIQEKSLYDLKRLKQPCKYCNHSMRKITFKHEIREIHPDIEILSDYVNGDTPIKCKCLICNNEWSTIPRSLLQGSGCKICGYKKRWDTIGRKTTEDIIDEMKIINPNIEIIGEYNGAHNLIKCRCKIDGKEWESYVCNLLNKSAGCPECALNHIREIESLSISDINYRLESLGIDVEVLEGYTNNKSRVKCLCKKHNIQYEASVKTLLYNRSSGCPKCNQSRGEEKMMYILKNMGYNIKPQYIFDDCKYIKPLRFDGYDLENNTVFEYQGQQHYYPVDFSGKGQCFAESEFNINVIRDNIKREYCKTNNIKMIEIPYWEYDNMEDFLFKVTQQND